jgi:PhzF family phenazine biosynthesis protein
MQILIYQVDAFTEKPFAGNPAGVCVLPRPAPSDWMQSVAAEVNASETAFVAPREDGGFDLRWFTPTVEVALCGHATLAASHILYETGVLPPDRVAEYHTQSGLLQARRLEGRIELDFPSTPPEPCDVPGGILEALGVAAPRYIGRPRYDYLIEAESEALVRGLAPDFSRLRNLGVRGVIVTAASLHSDIDFVSRFFAPGVGIDEDPVTGSAHCALTPYWAEKLGKNTLSAAQVSKRGGTLQCTLAGDRVKLAGNAVTVLSGRLSV